MLTPANSGGETCFRGKWYAVTKKHRFSKEENHRTSPEMSNWLKILGANLMELRKLQSYHISINNRSVVENDIAWRNILTRIDATKTSGSWEDPPICSIFHFGTWQIHARFRPFEVAIIWPNPYATGSSKDSMFQKEDPQGVEQIANWKSKQANRWFALKMVCCYSSYVVHSVVGTVTLSASSTTATMTFSAPPSFVRTTIPSSPSSSAKSWR